jgi:hypothetical protein
MMKIEPPLMVAKGQAASGSGPQPGMRTASPPARKGIVTLISAENRLARQHDLKTLEEAKRLITEVQGGLQAGPGETLAAVHRLEPRCLVKLR